MNTQKHTDGPWRYSPAVASVFVEEERKHCPQICTLPAWGEENTANGHLIVAAPELFAALSDFLTYIDDPIMPLTELKARARATLNKANGSP